MRVLTKLDRYPAGYVHVDLDAIMAISHAEHRQRVLVLDYGEKVLIGDTQDNRNKLGIVEEETVN